MFDKKKVETTRSWADKKMTALYNEWTNANRALWEKAKQTYLKAEALKVYNLESPDGTTAKADLDQTKHSLLCAIGAYDSIVAEIKRLGTEHGNEMQWSWSFNFFTSHEQIELAIREFLKGN